MPKSKGAGKAKRAERERCLKELGGIRENLGEVYAQFNATSDPDALDACIFEISALRSRYNTAFKRYRDGFY